MIHRLAWVMALGAVLGTACRGSGVKPVPMAQENSAEPSPNARIYPAPLQSGAELFSREQVGLSSEADAGPAPSPMREDEALPIEFLKPRDSLFVTLHGRFVWHDMPAPAGGAEVDKAGLQKLNEKYQLTTAVDLSGTGRMRFRLTGNAFPMPAGTELRARTDRYGHILVWPDGKSYRIVPPGALRGVLNERRADVLPLVTGVEQPQGSGALLGLEVGKVEISAQLGRLLVWRGLVPGTDAAPLLCRLLVELVGVRPSATACSDSRVPLRAEYGWKSGGRLIWEVTGIERSADRSAQPLSLPPLQPWFKGDLLPDRPLLWLGRSELVSFRTRDAQPRARPDAGPNTEGLIAANRSEGARYLLLDGIPAAWLPAHTSVQIVGLRAGRYVVAWRDFLMTAQEPPATIELPAKISIGEDQDAGLEGGNR